MFSGADWLEGLVRSIEWAQRAAATEARFPAATGDWAEVCRVPLFDPAGTLEWYLYQARCYADPQLRPDFFMPEGYRISPMMRRVGQLLRELGRIAGAE